MPQCGDSIKRIEVPVADTVTIRMIGEACTNDNGANQVRCRLIQFRIQRNPEESGPTCIPIDMGGMDEKYGSFVISSFHIYRCPITTNK